MKKFFTPFLLLIISFTLKAQQVNFKAVPVPHPKGIGKTASFGPTAACDTVNLQAANNWQAFFYTFDTSGFIFGVSDTLSAGVRIIEDANYFDISSTANSYITGGLVYFAFANSTNSFHLDDSVGFKVYKDAGGVPGPQMASTSLTLGQIQQDVLNGQLTEFKFAQPVKLPTSKQFYVAVDHANLRWSNTAHDSLAIVASGDEDTTAAAFQRLRIAGVGTGWIPVNALWSSGGDSLDVNLYIFPYVSSSADGCSVLPVSIFNFGGTIKNNQAYLNWSTAVENNNKGFYVERSKDSHNFESVGFVQGAGNSSHITNYSYTDVSLKDINVSTTYYRLKQVDADGTSAYSKVISLNLENLQNAGKWKLYPNPVKNAATVELSLENASNVKAQLVSRDGKVLLNIDKGVLNKGIQQFYINTQNIAKGSYILRVTINDKTYSQLLIKQ